METGNNCNSISHLYFFIIFNVLTILKTKCLSVKWKMYNKIHFSWKYFKSDVNCHFLIFVISWLTGLHWQTLNTAIVLIAKHHLYDDVHCQFNLVQLNGHWNDGAGVPVGAILPVGAGVSRIFAIKNHRFMVNIW